MSQEYISREGDVVDEIAWRYYGTRLGRAVERLLDANPGLADHGPILPAGVRLVLPDLPAPVAVKGVKLWD